MACGHAVHEVGMRRFGVTGTCCRGGLIRRSMSEVFHQPDWPHLVRIDQVCYCTDKVDCRFEVLPTNISLEALPHCEPTRMEVSCRRGVCVRIKIKIFWLMDTGI